MLIREYSKFLISKALTHTRVVFHYLLGCDRQVSYKDRANMPYTEAVLLETLRLANLAPSALPHATTQDIFINDVVCICNEKFDSEN